MNITVPEIIIIIPMLISSIALCTGVFSRDESAEGYIHDSMKGMVYFALILVSGTLIDYVYTFL